MQYVTGNYDAVLDSSRAVCLCCQQTYIRYPQKIGRPLQSHEEEYPEWRWTYRDCHEEFIIREPDGRQTAMCPCGCDAVIGDKTYQWTTEEVSKWHLEGWGSSV